MESPFKLLYIDDETDNLVSFRAVFRRYYTIFTAISAAEAHSILATENINLIISDQRMPQTTGVQFFEQIKDQYPDAVRIILTGYSDVQAIIDAINKGKVYHYITKPWKVEELKIILDNALETLSLRRKNSSLETERNAWQLKAIEREKAQMHAQYETLRNQINPHFLFNSLNTLSALIATDPPKAIQFTNQFSKVYRALLEKSASDPLSILQQELDVVQSYIFLNQLRFGDNLKVIIDIPKERLKDCLPPFALQLLVENAIKHNVISDNKPLTIHITATDDGFLIVKNNLQKRGSVMDSTNIGLANLRARYALLTPQHLHICEQEGAFVAKIPLITEG